jgi:multidrug efflux pump subunit AcrB
MAGMIPTAYAIGGSDPILIPMTLSLAWGLGFGSFGSLVFIPAIFFIVWENNWEEMNYAIFQGFEMK